MDGQGHRRQTGKHSEPGFLLIYTFQCKAKNIFIEDKQHHQSCVKPGVVRGAGCRDLFLVLF